MRIFRRAYYNSASNIQYPKTKNDSKSNYDNKLQHSNVSHENKRTYFKYSHGHDLKKLCTVLLNSMITTKISRKMDNDYKDKIKIGMAWAP